LQFCEFRSFGRLINKPLQKGSELVSAFISIFEKKIQRAFKFWSLKLLGACRSGLRMRMNVNSPPIPIRTMASSPTAQPESQPLYLALRARSSSTVTIWEKQQSLVWRLGLVCDRVLPGRPNCDRRTWSFPFVNTPQCYQ
jgi:hypothetical protein